MVDELSLPRKSIELEDPGAHELASSSSDEHFSDASESRHVVERRASRSEATSPVPITRVERVDDEPCYGEVPGTEAYEKRVQDAVPDEVEVVPDGQRSRSASRVNTGDRPLTPGGSPIPRTVVERVDDEPCYGEVPGTEAYEKRIQDAVPDAVDVVPDGQRSRSASRVDAGDRPRTPGGSPIPKTVVERVDDAPSYGEVPGTDAYQKRLQDAVPDEVIKVHDEPPQNKKGGSPTSSINRSPVVHAAAEATAHGSHTYNPEPLSLEDNLNDIDGSEGDGDFGDDFDDFEEGGEGDDFGDFDDGFHGDGENETSFVKPSDQSFTPAPPPGLPVLDFNELTTLDHVVSATQPYLEEIYPTTKEIPIISTTNQDGIKSIFSERSSSLWSQLVAPPPLQPPDWVRSRIRRLFLVSLGVPVDLDEILPASKQKKLILPSIHIPGEKSPRPSADERNGALGRVKRENSSSASLDSSGSKSERKRKGPPPPPALDLGATSRLCATTDAALQNFTDEELQAHVKRLEELKERAGEVFEYWQKRLESALGDKEAFESVIENLVAHAKKIR
ncbi:uncharacterized protein EI97DRAFT_444947 [Westerdykella ornata]|uniref:Uncharacterized protein n=1 Tax=Westerdykella ornata TaxID=318751 RepID=A0A6A6JA12_WESOR|nr:uncharacterized protein EI97DRAFT_444947 [Westerdykella ornata]KAF2273421.1 hypothetical protein EI97DRAFT_444947 [Westerdykella ornata]